ncbi:MAG: VOC family protein [Desulfovibrionales bacterium]|nr:VOC family protein [Desulfovibrionales bacterium]
MIIEMDHLTLNVESPDRCMEFYTKVIGLVPENYDAWKKGDAKFPSVRINSNNMIHFFPPQMWEDLGDLICSPGKANHMCLAFEQHEWKALLERLELNGVDVKGPHTLMGSRGTGTSIFVVDPEGFTLELKVYDQNQ